MINENKQKEYNEKKKLNNSRKLTKQNKNNKRTIKKLDKECSKETEDTCIHPCKWDGEQTKKKSLMNRIRRRKTQKGKCVVDPDKLYKSDINTKSNNPLCQTPFQFGIMPLGINDKTHLNIMEFESSKKVKDPSSMINNNGNYILYTKNYQKLNSGVVNGELFLLCKIKDKKQKLQIRFIPCKSSKKTDPNQSTGVGDKYTFMTTNENAKKWAEGIAQHSIRELILKYYQSRNYNSSSLKDTVDKNKSHNLLNYKTQENIYLNPDCAEKGEVQCKIPSNYEIPKGTPNYHLKKPNKNYNGLPK